MDDDTGLMGMVDVLLHSVNAPADASSVIHSRLDTRLPLEEETMFPSVMNHPVHGLASQSNVNPPSPSPGVAPQNTPPTNHIQHPPNCESVPENLQLSERPLISWPPSGVPTQAVSLDVAMMPSATTETPKRHGPPPSALSPVAKRARKDQGPECSLQAKAQVAPRKRNAPVLPQVRTPEVIAPLGGRGKRLRKVPAGKEVIPLVEKNRPSC